MLSYSFSFFDYLSAYFENHQKTSFFRYERFEKKTRIIKNHGAAYRPISPEMKGA